MICKRCFFFMIRRPPISTRTDTLVPNTTRCRSDQSGRGQALEEGVLTMALFELTSNDLRFVAQRLPRDVRDLLKLHHGKLFLGGGFIRAVVAGETPNDIDLFGSDAEWLKNVASGLSAQRPVDRTSVV